MKDRANIACQVTHIHNGWNERRAHLDEGKAWKSPPPLFFSIDPALCRVVSGRLITWPWILAFGLVAHKFSCFQLPRPENYSNFQWKMEIPEFFSRLLEILSWNISPLLDERQPTMTNNRLNEFCCSYCRHWCFLYPRISKLSMHFFLMSRSKIIVIIFQEHCKFFFPENQG